MRSTSFLIAIASIGVSLAAAGCTDLSSADLKTAGMSANFTVQADGSGTTNVSGNLNVDNNGTDYVTLASGDTLVASVAGQTETMAQSNVAGVVTYSAAFSGQDGANAAYTVALQRKSDVSAPNSTCSLPDPFTIGSPATGASFSRAADINVNYGAGGSEDSVEYMVQGSCIQGPIDAAVSGDPGTFTLGKGSITVAQGQSPQQSCQATLTITRTRTGTIDPAYGSGGSIRCVQTRSVTFTSTP